MPIYEYRCEACGEELEKIQKFSDPPLTDCPACGKPALKKLVSASSFRLKGSGWYETDFKNKKKPGVSDRSDGGGTSDAGTGSSSAGSGGKDKDQGKQQDKKSTGSAAAD